jgi:hypothetical protein
MHRIAERLLKSGQLLDGLLLALRVLDEQDVVALGRGVDSIGMLIGTSLMGGHRLVAPRGDRQFPR